MTRVSSGARAALAAGLALAGLLVCPGAQPAPASDHADPVDVLRLGDNDDRGLTGLFCFPVDAAGRRVEHPKDGTALVLILCANRSLAKPPPYRGLEAFEFTICVDTARKVNIHYPADLARPANTAERDTARYGGVVAHPDTIDPTFTITMRLKNDLAPSPAFDAQNFLAREVKVDRGNGLEPVDLSAVTKWGAGVRDDPFIFPMFFGTNVIAMAVEVPYGVFPGGEDLLLWATAKRNGRQIDHVGRSQRTQLPRFDLLNTIPPREHVRAIRESRANPGLMDNLLRFAVPSEFGFREFDEQPDVMVFTKGRASGYPNGRRLEDDVAKLACEQGDCQLYELSFVRPRSPEAERYGKYAAGRPTANDRPFLAEWPYLAEAQEEPNPPPGPPELTTRTLIVLGALVLFVAAVFLLPWVLLYRSKRQLRRLHQSLVAATVAQGPAAPVPAPLVPPPGTGGAQP